MNIKGIALFLGLSHLLLALGLFVLRAAGLLNLTDPNLFQYLLIAAMMGIPALAAVCAAHFFPDDAPFLKPMWPVPAREFLIAVLAAPALFAASHTIAAVLGLTQPQWGLGGLLNRAQEGLSAPLEPGVAAAAPVIALVVYPLISAAAGATLFAFLALGGEIGWRAYLVPRLAALGTLGAALAAGAVWGIWFLPWAIAWYVETGAGINLATLARVVVCGMVLAPLLVAVFRRGDNLAVPALWVGAFAGQVYGIWPHLFEQASPPWTGAFGWINIATWGLAAALVYRRSAKPAVA